MGGEEPSSGQRGACFPGPRWSLASLVIWTLNPPGLIEGVIPKVLGILQPSVGAEGHAKLAASHPVRLSLAQLGWDAEPPVGLGPLPAPSPGGWDVALHGHGSRRRLPAGCRECRG